MFARYRHSGIAADRVVLHPRPIHVAALGSRDRDAGTLIETLLKSGECNLETPLFESSLEVRHSGGCHLGSSRLDVGPKVQAFADYGDGFGKLLLLILDGLSQPNLIGRVGRVVIFKIAAQKIGKEERRQFRLRVCWVLA